MANGIDGNSLRMSNAVTDGNFGNWVFSQRLTTPVTEDADGNEFVAEFQIESDDRRRTSLVCSSRSRRSRASVGLA